MRPLGVGVGVALLGALPAGAAGQRLERYEFSVAVGTLRSIDRVLDPYGYAVSLAFVANKVRLVGTFGDYHGSASRTGFFCDRYWPEYTACASEPAQYTSRARVFDLALLVASTLREPWRVELGAGVGWSWFDGRQVSRTSGRETGPFPGGIVGITLRGRVSRALPGPLRAFASARTLMGGSSGCATDVDAPFCGALAAVDLMVGVSTEVQLPIGSR